MRFSFIKGPVTYDLYIGKLHVRVCHLKDGWLDRYWPWNRFYIAYNGKEV